MKADGNEKGGTSWTPIIILFCASILLLLQSMSDREALRDRRASAQVEIQRLALNADQRMAFQSDIARAGYQGEVDEVLWKARWYGDQAYRERVQREAAERQPKEKGQGHAMAINASPSDKKIVAIIAATIFFTTGVVLFRRIAYAS